MEDYLSTVSDGLNTALSNPLITGIGGAVVGATIGSVVTSAIIGQSSSSSSGNSRKRGSRIKHTKRGLKQDRARRSKQKWEVAYQKRKAKKNKKGSKSSRRGIRYTKRGQPYKILSNGRARFIKK